MDNGGVFTDEAGPYAGLFISEGQPGDHATIWPQSGHLVQQAPLSHSYPHCWRCKKPVIFRATEQWFISMEENGLRQKALAAIREVNWVPNWGMERIYGMVETRPDWCLSRQRAWGVPITAILCSKCGEVQNDRRSTTGSTHCSGTRGRMPGSPIRIADFLGGGYGLQPVAAAREFVKEEDILDVWFDSGTSHAAVLEERPELSSPADLYLEGSDQHRGWFQSSLLASVGTRGMRPLPRRPDPWLRGGRPGAGRCPSRVGNVIAPEKIIKQYGAEILRLWVASEDYRDDIKISDKILRQLSDAYRKIRNTMRYLLGNLSDFDPAGRQCALRAS